MEQLPKWVLADTHPAFYDTESATAIEMVAKLYKVMQDQIGLDLDGRMNELEKRLDALIIGALDEGDWDLI